MLDLTFILDLNDLMDYFAGLHHHHINSQGNYEEMTVSDYCWEQLWRKNCFILWWCKSFPVRQRCGLKFKNEKYKTACFRIRIHPFEGLHGSNSKKKANNCISDIPTKSSYHQQSWIRVTFKFADFYKNYWWWGLRFISRVSKRWSVISENACQLTWIIYIGSGPIIKIAFLNCHIQTHVTLMENWDLNMNWMPQICAVIMSKNWSLFISSVCSLST